MLANQKDIDSALAKFEVSASGCWLWTAALDRGGYGAFSYRLDGKRLTVRAHRAIYAHLVGPIDAGLDLDHLCRVRRCVNPEHLEPVTRAENTRRGTNPIGARIGATHCPAGHELTPENTYASPNRPTSRSCRTCKVERTREWRRQRSTAA